MSPFNQITLSKHETCNHSLILLVIAININIMMMISIMAASVIINISHNCTLMSPFNQITLSKHETCNHSLFLFIIVVVIDIMMMIFIMAAIVIINISHTCALKSPFKRITLLHMKPVIIESLRILPVLLLLA